MNARRHSADWYGVPRHQKAPRVQGRHVAISTRHGVAYVARLAALAFLAIAMVLAVGVVAPNSAKADT